ncbi:MAG TPA: outer membrane beta-barrel protein [Nitrospiria bacterium]|nr:outer membrane beta-barrel protein [Nitrospiria bacterium]
MNPIKPSAFPSFRLSVRLAALLVLLSAPASADWGVELTPFAGFRLGGNFQDNTTGLDLDVDEGESFGLILDVQSTHETQYELFYSFQKTELQGDGLFGGDPLFDLDIHYLHIGGTYLLPGERVRPFVGGGLGITYFSPDGPGLDSEVYFSLSLGVGAKIPISKRLGVRLEGRGFLTILPEHTDIFCVSSGGAACDVRVQGDVFGQVLFLAGISFGL